MKGSFIVWRLSRIFSILLIFSFLFIFNITPVSANTIKVNTTEDQNGTDLDHCSLREAIISAQDDTAYGGCSAGSGSDIITLGAGVFTVSDGQVDFISSEITINGLTSSSTIIQPSTCDPIEEECSNDHQFVRNTSGGTLSLNNLTLRYWKNTGDLNGGILLNNGILNISDCVLSNNRAVYGGAFINSGGTVTITNSAFTSNMAHNYSDYNTGGAIYNALAGPGSITIQESTFSGNSGSDGGAIFNYGLLDIINSTFSENTASFSGGAIYVHNNTASLINVTLSGNVASSNGGGIFNDNDGTLNFINTIIANSTSSSDCYNDEGTINTNTNNLVEDGSCNADFSGDPALGPLADNGGPTLTHALLLESIAINTGNLAACPDTDQRGVTRPQGLGCDIGAYEYEFQTIFLPLLMK